MKIRVNLSLDPEVLASLAKLSALNRRSQSQYVEDLVLQAENDEIGKLKSEIESIKRTSYIQGMTDANPTKPRKYKLVTNTIDGMPRSYGIDEEVPKSILREEPPRDFEDAVQRTLNRFESQMSDLKSQISELKSKKKK